MANIKLKCPCGASLDVSTTFDMTVESIVKEWNSEHKGHKRSPKNAA